MNSALLRSKTLVYKSIIVCLSSLLLSDLGAAKASNKQETDPLSKTPQLQPIEQVEPSLRTPEPILIRPTMALPSTDSFAVAAPLGADLLPEVVEQPVHLRLSLSDRRVYVHRGNAVEASFPVAIGKPGWETPTGEFEVFSQISQPGWTNPFTDEVMPPGSENPLGDRWIGFWSDGNNVIGFHGTPNRDSVGQAASHGCVRMYNEDIRQLFDMVKLGTPVIVEP
ncbi:L,D-transpeptidase [Nodosilinea sp. FACHB-13]|uniref:L,D-transpeptidase n=1 Tax=Nodosilinea sp. FACHB-13 TaxID=2692831 RepID=UPI001683AD36|nr:L,D-transpeptidase [Nodosilinea sp. FACHB-13]MBD2109663.1 L,D-transpeptidase [Nodosilinea sp. FACHB-13]